MAVIILASLGRGNPATGENEEESKTRRRKNPKPYHLPPRRRTQLRGLGNGFSFERGRQALTELFVRFPRRCFTAVEHERVANEVRPRRSETSSVFSYVYLGAKHVGQMERKNEGKDLLFVERLGERRSS